MAKFEVISKKTHSDKRWKRFVSFSFAGKDAICPLVAKEMPTAMMCLPIGFVRQGSTYVPVAIQGLIPEHNLLVAADGNWLGRYIPEAYRAYPFRMLDTDDGKKALCFDSESGLLSDDLADERFFDEDGEPSHFVSDTANFLLNNSASRDATSTICEELDSHKLFETWPITAQIGEENVEVNGLSRINETALNELCATDFASLRDSRALTVAYCQLLSMQHLEQIVRLANNVAAPAPLTDEVLFGSQDENDTLCFDNF